MRPLGYLWASPITAIGLALALLTLLTGGSAHLRAGVVEVTGGLAGWLLRGNRLWRGGAAMTLGHVILARDAKCLERSRPHEERHVRQFERWGPLLLPGYTGSSGRGCGAGVAIRTWITRWSRLWGEFTPPGE